MRGFFFVFLVFITIFSLLIPDFDRRLYREREREGEKKKAIPLSQTIISVFQPVSFDAEPVTH